MLLTNHFSVKDGITRESYKNIVYDTFHFLKYRSTKITEENVL
jgi:hypothetical protein